MKNLTLLCFAIIVVALGANVANAQYGYQNNFDQMQRNMEARMNQMTQMANQRQQALQQQMNQHYAMMQRKAQLAQADIIKRYRQRTGDYNTPDHICVQRAMAEYYQKNPEAYRQKMANDRSWQQISQRGHQMRMNDIQSWGRTNQMIADTNNHISDQSMRGFYNRSQASDRLQANWVNSMHGRENVYNPNTGQRFNVEYAPNQIQTYNNGYPIYTDNNSRHFQYNGTGFDELEDDN